ncbi:hypothetical protein PPERSA_10788 [Pseudocohnilembus persalinus]|uniref:Uncharacterized protein n=1 Tax=Pseudocohnilembus persalinus TaxID=266149 RepID=A0A0V0QDK4_PSEPJ|nr:hypothetical protein PPERSA_10788 [Pseudocohnilembus persalinus]|eukprot:KRX00289.1 hypothetical protein PPERSA_10788 [Pseudocohnilembus persalinus]
MQANLQQKPNDLFIWSVERCPSFSKNLVANNQNSWKFVPKIDNLYINIADLIRFLFSKFKFANVKELNLNLVHKIKEIFSITQPKKGVFLAMDGVKPAAFTIKEKDLLFQLGDYSGNYISLNHLLPGSQNIKSVREQLDVVVNQFFFGEENYQFRDELKVVFSDFSVPGDASYKIGQFIQKQRAQDGFEEEMYHCIVDTSFEGFVNCLATHQKNMFNLSFKAINTSQYKCIKCKRNGHFYNQCLGSDDSNFSLEFNSPDYQLYDFFEFRKFEFGYINFPEYNEERIIDDLIFIFNFHGGVILPELNFPSIQEGGLDIMIYIYKRSLPHLGYITLNGQILKQKAGLYLREVGNIEDIVIKNCVREHQVDKFKNPQHIKNWKEYIKNLKQNIGEEYRKDKEDELVNIEGDEDDEVISQQDQIKQIIQRNLADIAQQTGRTVEEVRESELGENEKAKLEQDEPVSKSDNSMRNYLNLDKIKSSQFSCIDEGYQNYEDILIDFSKYTERFYEGISFNDIFSKPEQEDISSQETWQKVTDVEKKLQEVGEKDYRKSFYLQKFKIQAEDFSRHIKNLQENYLAAIQWSLSYFFKGYVSWNWCYEYNYAPFISDLHPNYEKIEILFNLGQPIKILEYQLIMTHPSQSSSLPLVYQHFFIDSEIVDMWPYQYSSDFNWNYTKTVTIIPPFDVDRLQAITSRYELLLNDEQYLSNRFGKEVFYSRRRYLQEYKDQYREVLNNKKDALSGELIYYPQNNKEEKAHKYFYIEPALGQYKTIKQPNQKSDQVAQIETEEQKEQKEEVKEQRKALFNYDQAEILDQILYRNNPIIQHIERALISEIDKAEQYNKGLINQQIPPQIAQNNNFQKNPKKHGPPQFANSHQKNPNSMQKIHQQQYPQQQQHYPYSYQQGYQGGVPNNNGYQQQQGRYNNPKQGYYGQEPYKKQRY